MDNKDEYDATGEPKFRGQIIKGSTENGFGFVGIHTVKQISGPAFTLPTRDLMVHVSQNRRLSEPFDSGTWIKFRLKECARASTGFEVIGAVEE